MTSSGLENLRCQSNFAQDGAKKLKVVMVLDISSNTFKSLPRCCGEVFLVSRIMNSFSNSACSPRHVISITYHPNQYLVFMLL
jgi:hypothetical protein